MSSDQWGELPLEQDYEMSIRQCLKQVDLDIGVHQNRLEEAMNAKTYLIGKLDMVKKHKTKYDSKAGIAGYDN